MANAQKNLNDQIPVIKGGYYVAPSGPAKPLVETSVTWGTAMPSLASGERQPSQQNQNQSNAPVPPPASNNTR